MQFCMKYIGNIWRLRMLLTSINFWWRTNKILCIKFKISMVSPSYTICQTLYGFFPHSWLITGFLTRLTRRVSLVEQELPTLPQHLSSPTVFSGVPVTRHLVLCGMVCRSLFVLSTFSFDHCVVCSSIYEFWSLHWHLQTLFKKWQYSR